MFWSLLFECSGSIFKSLRQHLNILFELLCIHNFKFKSSVGFRDELELYITEFCQLTTSLMMEWWSSATQRHLLAKVFFILYFEVFDKLMDGIAEGIRYDGLTRFWLFYVGMTRSTVKYWRYDRICTNQQWRYMHLFITSISVPRTISRDITVSLVKWI